MSSLQTREVATGGSEVDSELPLDTAPQSEKEGEERLPTWEWDRDLYYRAADLGLFKPDEKLELIDGEVYKQVSPQSPPHALSIIVSALALQDAFGPGYHTRQEKPINISRKTEPEPDVAVVKGSPRDYRGHPTSVNTLLVMEISDTTYRADSQFKASLYASVGIPEYWVLNLKKRELEVRRQPIPDAKARFGFSYEQLTAYREGESVAPLSAPDNQIPVSSLLPNLPEAKEGASG